MAYDIITQPTYIRQHINDRRHTSHDGIHNTYDKIYTTYDKTQQAYDILEQTAYIRHTP